jgi:rhamnogalacturonan endolyase
VTKNKRIVSFFVVIALLLIGVSNFFVRTNTTHAASYCQVTYTVTNQWAGGFGGSIVVQNTSPSAWTSWKLGFTFPASGQTITQGWNATFAQSGQNVTVTNLSYNGAVAPNGSINPGFNGTWTSSNPVPTSFTVNGNACNGSTAPTPTPQSTSTPGTNPSPTPQPTDPPGSNPPTPTPTPAVGGVTLQASGMTATISNQFYTVKFNSKGTGYSLVMGGKELIGSAPGFYSSINGGTGFAPTSLQVVTNTSSMADIAYIGSWGALHYVVRGGVSGMYSYFVASGIGTVGEFRTLYQFNEGIFANGFNNVRTITFPTASQLAASTSVQDATYKLPDGTIYTKYDMSNYTFTQDTIHGVYGNGHGAWVISPSHEYNNGGPMKQDLTVHVGTTNNAIALNMLVSGHFGTGSPQITIPSGKIYGPWFVYFNNGNISDAQAQVAVQQAQWPYTWLNNPSYPLSRTTVTGTLHLAGGRAAAGATITLAQPGGNVYTQGSGYIFTTQAASDGSFSIPKVRPGSYSLYAWANGGSIGDVTDQFEQDNINVSGSTQNLGAITWSPPTYGTLLWQIGTADRKAGEFNLGNAPRQYGLWNQVPANLTYTIGQSSPANNWYYAQAQSGTWTVQFNASQTFSGTAHLTVALAGATRSPSANVSVNGTRVSTLSGFANDEGIYRSANQSGIYHLQVISFNASLLKAGSNTITFQATVGSGAGIMYDTIKLEA